jgi:hypothetical protein
MHNEQPTIVFLRNFITATRALSACVFRNHGWASNMGHGLESGPDRRYTSVRARASARPCRKSVGAADHAVKHLDNMR